MKRNREEDKDYSSCTSSSCSNSLLNNSSGNETSGTAATVRTTGRVKKPKQVYDPSDYYIGKRQTMLVNRLAEATYCMDAADIQSVKSEKDEDTDAATVPDTVSRGVVLATATPTNGSSAEPPAPPPPKNLTFDTCMKCHKSEPKRGSGHKSNFLTCKTCLRKWHFHCMSINFENLSLARKKYRCERCRSCTVCLSGKHARIQKDKIVCSMCVETYHLECHHPPVLDTKLVGPKWKCAKCVAKINSVREAAAREAARDAGRKSKDADAMRKSVMGPKKKANVGLASNGKPTHKLSSGDEDASMSSCSSLPPLQPITTLAANSILKKKRRHSNEDNLPSTHPPPPLYSIASQHLSNENENERGNVDKIAEPVVKRTYINLPVQHWTTDEVVSFVHKRYPNEANVFKFQDIDGVSLMLLTRYDILNRFGLKVGPSLRLYELVTTMQNHADDIRMAWSK
ncbi:uncharacterized protein LOC115627395 [Scaptodrosophila lebanonensis]|uniref:Uncharacterized protein LOC115627395 n=1 Tax=Drosophila lebanonensis TaxID=7225 RepID=A0A6J2TTK8_DROLE|nr:uncharacterized protein LOC115627395 [Scaptodrosophila lebanonensis]